MRAQSLIALEIYDLYDEQMQVDDERPPAPLAGQWAALAGTAVLLSGAVFVATLWKSVVAFDNLSDQMNSIKVNLKVALKEEHTEITAAISGLDTSLTGLDTSLTSIE
jgi:hypothetical protein